MEKKELSIQELKKIEELQNRLNKQMADIDKKILESKKEIRSINKIKRIKIILFSLKTLFPFTLSTVGFLSVLKFGFQTYPFSIDNIKHYLYTRKYFDNEGNTRIEEKYSYYDTDYNLIYHYGKYELDENNSYRRNVDIYNAKEFSEEEIKELIYSKEKTEEFLNNPIESYVEINNNLSEEEINRNEYIEALVYSKNKNEYIEIKEEVSTEILVSLAFVFSQIITFAVPVMTKITPKWSEINRQHKDDGSNVTYLTAVKEIKQENMALLMKYKGIKNGKQ